MKTAFIISFLLFFDQSIFSQSDLSKFTYSIVDTTQSKIEQVKDIYDWITNNIEYDTKQLQNGIKHYSPIQTIHRKKAVCQGYSELFHEMCKILNIESYIILGYCKGLGYVSGDNFARSNHMWNIIKVDTNWIIIDATWGSGSLYYDYDLISKLKLNYNRNQVIKKKIKYSKNQDLKYFNISPDDIKRTHFPLDSKWQISEYPQTYYTYITDSFSNSPYLNYEKEISYVRLKDFESQIFTDAINSKKYNPYNRFDIANQHFIQAQKINLNNRFPIDSIFLENLNKSLEYYDTVFTNLRVFKSINQKFYKKKKSFEKNSYKKESNVIKKTSKLPSTYNEGYIKTNKQFLKNEILFDKFKQNAYNSISNYSKRIIFSFDSLNTFDTLLYRNLISKSESDYSKVILQFTNIELLKSEMINKIESEKNLNDSILNKLSSICMAIQSISDKIDLLDEFQIFANGNRLLTEYNYYNNLYNEKQQIKNLLFKDFNNFQDSLHTVDQRLNSILNTYFKLVKLTGINSYFSSKSDSVFKMLQKAWSINLSIILLINNYNENWKSLLKTQNETLGVFGKDGLSEIHRKLTVYFRYISDKNEKTYLNDLQLANEMINRSKGNVLKIKKYIKK